MSSTTGTAILFLSFLFITLTLLCGSHLCVTLTGLLNEPTQAQIVDNILNSLDVILDSIGSLAEDVILEVEKLEPGKKILDEPANNERKFKVSVGNSVGSQTGQLVGEVCQRQQVLLDGEVEGVTILEVCRNCEWSAWVLRWPWIWITYPGKPRRLARG